MTHAQLRLFPSLLHLSGLSPVADDNEAIYCYVPRRGVLVDIKLPVFTQKLVNRPEVSLLLLNVVEVTQGV